MDATIIRCFLVPAMMSYSGDLTWWAPSWVHEAAMLLVPDEMRINEEKLETYTDAVNNSSSDHSSNPIHDGVGSSSDWEMI